MQIVNISNGERFETYTIVGERGSGKVGLNGPAARKVQVGDIIIVIAYGHMTPEEAAVQTDLGLSRYRNQSPHLVICGMKAKQVLTYVISLGIGVVTFYETFSFADDKEALWKPLRSAREGLPLRLLWGIWPSSAITACVGAFCSNRWVASRQGRSVHAVALPTSPTRLYRAAELARCAALNQPMTFRWMSCSVR